MLRFYDTATRRKVDFEPRVEGRVSMYVCGPTPYDAAHLGHGRTYVVFDTIRRYLEWSDYVLSYVINITDIEDKIISRSRERGISEAELVAEYEAAFWNDMDRLNVKRPDEMPRATEFIAQMQALIAELIAKGAAYEVEGQGVYFQVDAYPEYGKLSHRTLAELLESAGARVDVDERKRSPVDFALWKAAKAGEPEWDSPWGKGRPGWHIECSAMSLEILGERFDIHGGGADLEFPHHENEIAQAEGAGHSFAQHWLHSGMVNVDGEKMSKSLGNFTTLRDLLDEYGGPAFRLLVLQTHYRRQMEVGAKELRDAEKAIDRINALMRRARRADVPTVDAGDTSAFRTAMDDDFDTPAAIAVIFELVRDANTALDEHDADRAAVAVATIRDVMPALGLEWDDEVPELDTEIATLVAARDEARERRDFAEADRLRDELQDRSIVLEDTAQGTVWRRS